MGDAVLTPGGGCFRGRRRGGQVCGVDWAAPRRGRAGPAPVAGPVPGDEVFMDQTCPTSNQIRESAESKRNTARYHTRRALARFSGPPRRRQQSHHAARSRCMFSYARRMIRNHGRATFPLTSAAPSLRQSRCARARAGWPGPRARGKPRANQRARPRPARVGSPRVLPIGCSETIRPRVGAARRQTCCSNIWWR